MPTTETIARRSSVQTSPSSPSSRTTGSRRLRSSTVSETLTSPLASTSTTTSCRSKTSNMARRNPYAPSIRGARTLITVIPRFQEMDRIGESPIRSSSAAGSIVVPGSSARRELSTTIGMPSRTSGIAVAGCSTFAPKVASSAASS